ncbi:hypothetical protein U5801_21425 [Lamprobacter modestohalophilus]|uniref:hypothetical protein n=1 Tax=Lamprobacter modestohalophilus TaxID=1064514 RepID=UPI002ADEF56E|nr:hypothetical protein [Lamprobacter modestohalophilus]MEA1052346.1 hypothetical protein [Lamprobacter modestohalophilus]
MTFEHELAAVKARVCEHYPLDRDDEQAHRRWLVHYQRLIELIGEEPAAFLEEQLFMDGEYWELEVLA